MKWFKISLGLIVVLFCSSAFAAEIKVTDNLVFTIDVGQGWSLYLDEPPEALVKETAKHIAHEPAAANATQEQIDRVARKRLMANEAIIYHAETGAHLDIDFSPLEEGEKPPNSRTLKDSAKYAAESLANEDDVEEVVSQVSSAKIDGVSETYLLSANYLQHDHPMTFRGYIGFAADSWFFLYFTAPGKNPAALGDLDAMMNNASVETVGP